MNLVSDPTVGSYNGRHHSWVTEYEVLRGYIHVGRGESLHRQYIYSPFSTEYFSVLGFYIQYNRQEGSSPLRFPSESGHPLERMAKSILTMYSVRSTLYYIRNMNTRIPYSIVHSTDRWTIIQSIRSTVNTEYGVVSDIYTYSKYIVTWFRMTLSLGLPRFSCLRSENTPPALYVDHDLSLLHSTM